MQKNKPTHIEQDPTSFLNSISGSKHYSALQKVADMYLDHIDEMHQQERYQDAIIQVQESIGIDYQSLSAAYEEFVFYYDENLVTLYPELIIEPGVTFPDYLIQSKVVNKSELNRLLSKHYSSNGQHSKSDAFALTCLCVGYGSFFLNEDRIYAFNNCIEYRVLNAAAKILDMPTFKNSLEFDKKYEISGECFSILQKSYIKHELDKLESGCDNLYFSTDHFTMGMFEFIYQLCQKSASIFESKDNESFSTVFNLIALTLYPICNIFQSVAFISYTLSRFGGNHLLPIVNCIYRRHIIPGTLTPIFESNGELSALTMQSTHLIKRLMRDEEIGFFESLDKVLASIPDIHQFACSVIFEPDPIELMNQSILKHNLKICKELNAKHLPCIKISTTHLPDHLKNESMSALANLENKFEELYGIDINKDNCRTLLIKAYSILRYLKKTYSHKNKLLRASDTINEKRALARSCLDNNELSEAKVIIGVIDGIQKGINQNISEFTTNILEAIHSCFESLKDINCVTPVSLDSVCNTEMIEREQLEALKSANNQKILQLESSIERLNTNIDRLTDIVAEKNDAILNLERRLQGALSKKTGEISESLKLCMYGRPLYNDVITAIRELYPYVTFADNIEKVISKCNYENPSRVFKYLNLICSDYFNSIKSGKPDTISKEILEPYYSANESNTTVQDVKLRTMREFPFNGSKVLITKHLTIGDTFNPSKTVQIFFDIHLNEVRIGYIGQHLKTAS